MTLLLLHFEEEKFATEVIDTRDLLDQTFIKNEHFCIILARAWAYDLKIKWHDKWSDEVVLVECEKVGLEVSGAAQFQERHPAAGLDDEDCDAAIVNT